MNPTSLASVDQRDNWPMESPCNLPKKSQHTQYAQHFPIPFESITAHDSSQRLVLLHGVGKARTKAIATSKEVTKALCAMLNELGRLDDSGLGADGAQNSEHVQLKRERDEKRAVLYRWMPNMYLRKWALSRHFLFFWRAKMRLHFKWIQQIMMQFCFLRL